MTTEEIAETLGSLPCRAIIPRLTRRKGTMMYAYKVLLNGKEIDKVFYNTKQDRDDVKQSLVNHDGYDPRMRERG